MAVSGITPTNRIEGTTERDLSRLIVDNITNTPILAARLLANSKRFTGKTMDITQKISRTEQGEWFHGMPTLNAAATDTTVTSSYAHVAYSHPIVIPIEEAMANAGDGQSIPLIAFKHEEATQEAIEDLATAFYASGTGDYPLGVGAIVDDGTAVDTIGGTSRATYTPLKATKTASGGTLSLAKMATMFNTIAPGGLGMEKPTVIVTDPATWALYESLLNPTITTQVNGSGYDMLPIKGDRIVKAGQLLGAAGFQVLTFRGVAILADPYCPVGYMYFLNENFLTWYGRDVVPAEFRGKLEKISLGKAKTIEGGMTMPSDYHGFFKTEMLMHPDQPGAITRLYLFGQLVPKNFRRQGVLTGVTGV